MNKKTREFNPDYCVHPIETILEVMRYRVHNDMTIPYKPKMAEYLLETLINKECSRVIRTQITEELASEIKDCLNIPVSFLLNNQESYNKFYGIEI